MDHRFRTFETDFKVVTDLIALDTPGYRGAKTEDIA
jgi:hypothetical protein